MHPGDVVILHDPQTLGFAPGLASAGIPAIWNCHIGADTPNEQTREAWRFLARYVKGATRQVFSRPHYRWEGLNESRVRVIPPCIDAFAPKNEPLDDEQVRSILATAGVVPNLDATIAPTFERSDGSKDTVARRARIIEDEPVGSEAAIVCQISRWDPLKDHLGVMQAFSEHVPRSLGAQLVLAGPMPESVADDPEGQQTLDELVDRWHELEPDARRRVHICCVPMDDAEENAAIINALQRRADVVVQKSLAEGFGLTVAEAMWKGRPTIGSRVGGIQDQITSGETGLLTDPDDPEEFGAAVTRLLQNRDDAARMSEAAQARVLQEYLAPIYLTRQFALIGETLDHQP